MRSTKSRVRTASITAVLACTFIGIIPLARPLVKEAELVLRGRCLDSDSEPLEGCRISGKWRSREEGRPPSPFENITPVVSDERGVFALRLEPTDLFDFELLIEADGRSPAAGRWTKCNWFGEVALGIIKLPIGYAMSGKIIDSNNRPVSGLPVVFPKSPVQIPTSSTMGRRITGLSDKDGQFQMDHLVPIGTNEFLIANKGYRIKGRKTIEITDQPRRVTILVDEVPMIKGRVVRKDGTPLQRTGIHILDGSEHTGKLEAITDLSGSFTLYPRPGETEPVSVMVTSSDFCASRVMASVEWDTHDLEIVVPDWRSLELIVVDKETQSPIETYAVSGCGIDSGEFKDFRLREDGFHPDGRLVVSQLSEGLNRIKIQMTGSSFGSRVFITEIPSGAVSPLTVEVEPVISTLVFVVDGKNQPVINHKVTVADQGVQLLRVRDELTDYALEAGKAAGSVRLLQMNTNNLGVLMVPLPTSVAELEFTVSTSPGNVPRVIQSVEVNDRFENARRIKITVR